MKSEEGHTCTTTVSLVPTIYDVYQNRTYGAYWRKKIMSLASNSYQDIGPRRHNPRRIPVPSVKLTQIIFYRVCVDG